VYNTHLSQGNIFILMQVVLLLCLLCYFSLSKSGFSLLVLAEKQCSLLFSNINLLLVLYCTNVLLAGSSS
jgi:hypothetical protein